MRNGPSRRANLLMSLSAEQVVLLHTLVGQTRSRAILKNFESTESYGG